MNKISSKESKKQNFIRLPSMRKKNNSIITTEYGLRCKIVKFIREKYPEALLIAGLVENKKTNNLKISSGQCNLVLLNPTKNHSSLCIEFKSPAGDYQLSEKNGCKYLVSNDPIEITFSIVKHMEESNAYLMGR